MRHTIRRISTLVYGLGIVGALAFGANEALARAVYSSCIYHFPLLGACTNTGNPSLDIQNCINACDSVGPSHDYPHSTCTQPDNCCVCRS